MKRNNFKLLAGSLFILALAAGQVRAQGTYTASYLGGGIWEQDGNWSTTAYPNNGHFVLINGNPVPDGNPFYSVAINIAAPCTLGIGVTVQGVSIANGSTLNLANNSRLSVNGPLTSNGVITLNSTGSGSNLIIGNGSSLGATGAIMMSDHFANQVYAGNHGDTLTIAAGGTISGAGSLNIGFFGGTAHLLNFVNQGLIDATQPNALQIGLDTSVNANLTNTGTLRASSGGTLRLIPFGGTGTVSNAGGVLEALNGSTVRVGSGITVEGGMATSIGTGAIRGDFPGSGGGRISNVTNTGTIALADNEFLSLGGTITNNALIRLDGAGSGPTLRIANNTTLTGSGVITLSNNFSNTIEGVNTGDVFTIAASAKIQGSGTINPGPAGGSRMATITNQGVIEANNVANGLNIRIENFNNTLLTNTGTLRANNGATLRVFGTSTLDNTGGIIEALDSSNVRVGGGITVEGGTITSSGTGAIRGDSAGSGGGTLSSVTNIGTVAIAPGETVGLAGTLTNNGLVRLDSTGSASNLLLRSNVTIAGTGPITMGNDFNNAIAGDGALGYVLTIAPGATIQGGGHFGTSNNNFNPRTVQIVNQGLVESTSGMTIFLSSSANSDVTNSGTFRASNGATLAFQGAVTGTVTNSGGTLHVLPSCTISGDGGISLVQTAGTIDLDGGTMNFPLGLDLNGGQLIGKGTFIGPIRNNGGRVGPGHSPGKITVNGNYTQGASGRLEIEIGGAAPETGFDQLQVSGTAALDGILNISLINGFLPAVGDVFPFILQSAFTGAFSTINTTGFTGQVNYSSSAITITVLTVSGTPTPTPTATPAQLLNISTRLRVQTGDNALIGGFILTGTAPKRVIVRAIGPSLSAFGVQGALADPTLELRDGSGQLVAEDDNWRTGGQEAEIIATTIPPTNDFESAVVVTLPANNAAYTAIVRGKDDTTGIGLVEVYDLGENANSRLANISTRGFVETDDNAMIGGFILGGSVGASSRVVVRAIGPSLSAFGIAGALPDPTLELKDANGSTVMSNDDWQQTQEAEIIATGLAPTDIHESALVVSLPNGSYTGIVRGVGNTTGVGLVEIYNLQ